MKIANFRYVKNPEKRMIIEKVKREKNGNN